MPVIQSPILVGFNLFLFVIIVLLMRRAMRYPYRVKLINRRFAILLSLVFVLFSFWGLDWFHYLEAYSDLLRGESGHMEDIYVTIAQKFSFGYISFRFLIWGGGFVLFYILTQRYSLSADLILFFFLSLWLIWFSYARVSLAMILAYLGASLLYKPFSKKILSYIIGLMLISSSLLFHKTATFAVVVIALAILSGIVNKKMFAFIVPILVLVGPYFISSYFLGFMAMDTSEESIMDMSLRYGRYYLDADTYTIGIGALLQRVFEVTPYYILAILSYWTLLKRNVEREVAVNMRMLIIIVIFTTLLSFGYGVNTTVLYIRFMRFAFVPSSIIMAYMWSNNQYRVLTRITYYIALLGAFYSILYSLYCTIVG